MMGCSQSTDPDTPKEHQALQNGWEIKKQVVKQVDNYEFIFRDKGYAFEKRDSLVDECLIAIEENMKLIKADSINTPYKIVFYPSKAAMKYDINVKASGHADYWIKEVGFVCTDDPETIKKENIIATPIKHELMHMIAMEHWGRPPENVAWLNEGLATFAANCCNGYNVDEIYSYLLESNKLVHIDSLAYSFLDMDEMVSYHQSGYIAQYLIENYGLEKFSLFWKYGYENFEAIYEIPFSEMETSMNNEIVAKYPEPIEIDWERFKEGCK